MNLMMMFVIPIPFIFVLLILLLRRAPKVGAGAIVGVVIMGLLGAVLLLGVSKPRVVYEQSTEARVMVRQQTLPSRMHGDPDVAYEDFRQTRGAAVEFVTREPAVTAPIWSEGVENEYEADIYPSRLAAVRALGSPLQGWIQKVIEDANQSPEIVLFQEEHNRSLLWEFEKAIEKVLPEIPCSIEAGHRNIGWDEIGITLRFEDIKIELVPWSNVNRSQLASGRVLAKARNRERETTVGRSFIEKPWVENFSRYVSERPDGQFVVARSRETCTSENEAKIQAIGDACDQVSALIGQKWSTVPGQPPLTVSSTDLLEGGFILDQFVQSFDGLSGRLWRQAMLIDTSAQKLGSLGSRKTAAVKVVRVTWARMIVSALGVLVVIVATYLFLNMATRGYYVWSLRIAGTVLAIMGVISILLVLR